MRRGSELLQKRQRAWQLGDAELNWEVESEVLGPLRSDQSHRSHEAHSSSFTRIGRPQILQEFTEAD